MTKMWSSRSLRVGVLLLTCLVTHNNADIPCLVRDTGIEGRSILCECNANYCDTITRDPPEPGTYQVYTSTNDGQRFVKSSGTIQPVGTDTEDVGFWDRASIRLVPAIRYQRINGFGGSVTDAASINWRKLSDHTQAHLINSYFGSEGLEYNLIRVPIGGSDFSTHPYTYNELPWGDHALTNFSLSIEDYLYKIPMIRSAMRVATDEIRITATTWSPPIWMKTNENITGFGQVRTEYYQSYADYHLKFLEEYDRARIKIWAITTSNEPINGIVPFVRFNSIGWIPRQQARWIVNNLGPTIRNSPFSDTKIIGVDDQRYLLRIWMLDMEAEDHRVLDYLDGIGVHYYGNFAPSYILRDINNRYPDKFLIATEACEGPMPWDSARVIIGSWRRARRYTQNIMQDLNNYVTGWIDWNLCLDTEGGPNWADNFVDSPILVYGDEDRFVKQPMYYAMGHFSKFIPRESQRVHVMNSNILVRIDQLSVITPEGNYVIVLHNGRAREFQVQIQIDDNRQITIMMEPESIKTIEINPN